MQNLNDYPPPQNFRAIFDDNIWNAFYMIGLGYLVFQYPKNSNIIRLLPPAKTGFDQWQTEKKVLDFLCSKNLVEEIKDKPFIHHANRVNVSYALTASGQKLFDESLTFSDPKNIFIEKIYELKGKFK